MDLKPRYEQAKRRLLSDATICDENRRLFGEFFAFEEYKLQRQNGLRALDNACYKTLLSYVVRLRNVNQWFKDKPWKQLTAQDIKQVYDDLEDGRLRNKRGLPYGDLRGYYNRIIRSKPFALAGKADLAREVMEYSSRKGKKVVRYLDEPNFRKLVSTLSKPRHLLLFWLAWDIGENINTLLQLRVNDFTRRSDAHTNEPEYLVNLPAEKLKRSRQERSEPTLYAETVHYADMVLATLHDDDLLFPFGHRQAAKILLSAARRSGAVAQPKQDRILWKDFRSGMACHLLQQGWTTDEVKARLGHTPSSKAIDVYVTYLAIDRKRPKQKLQETNLRQVQRELEESREQQKLTTARMRREMEKSEELRCELAQTQDDVRQLRLAMQEMMQRLETPASLNRKRDPVESL